MDSSQQTLLWKRDKRNGDIRKKKESPQITWWWNITIRSLFLQWNPDVFRFLVQVVSSLLISPESSGLCLLNRLIPLSHLPTFWGKIHKALKMLRKKARVSHCSSLLTESQNEEDTSYGVGDNRGGNAMKSVRSLFRFPTPGKGDFAIFWFHLHANRANRSI